MVINGKGEHLYAGKMAFGIGSALCKLLKGIHVFRSIHHSYDVLTHQRRELYAHESTLKIVSASVNPQRTVLAFTAKKSKVIHDVAASSPGSQPVPPGS